MLAKKYRLPIQSVIKNKAQPVRGRFFFLKIYSPALNYGRFGVIISKKTAPAATLRNKLKRVVYDFIRIHREKFPIADYAITILPPAVSLPKDVFLQELTNLF